MGFKIDLHVHSRYSLDSGADPEDSVVAAIERGLQGIAFTEHYSYEASEPVEVLREKYGDQIMIFRGVEISAAEGHCLVFGVNTDLLSLKHAPGDEVVRIITDNGGVVIPTHPFRGGNSFGSRIMDITGFAAIEGYNGCNLHDLNMQAIHAAGKLALPFTGGSDAHAPEEVGSCYTEFFDPVTPDNLVDVLREGNYLGKDVRKISRGWAV